jgi:hypothetical protein
MLPLRALPLVWPRPHWVSSKFSSALWEAVSVLVSVVVGMAAPPEAPIIVSVAIWVSPAWAGVVVPDVEGALGAPAPQPATSPVKVAAINVLTRSLP